MIAVLKYKSMAAQRFLAYIAPNMRTPCDMQFLEPRLDPTRPIFYVKVLPLD